MAEYICREAILDDLEEEIEAGNAALDEDVWINKGLRIAIRDIKNIKTADVQPIKHGRWIHDTHTQWKCSECGNFLDFDGLNCGRGIAFYCPNCGADMRGDVEIVRIVK